jgi:hypothetical protein
MAVVWLSDLALSAPVYPYAEAKLNARPWRGVRRLRAPRARPQIRAQTMLPRKRDRRSKRRQNNSNAG